MASLSEIESELEDLYSFKNLVQVYEELASIRMNKTRDSVVKNRTFVTEVNDVFDKVRSSYADRFRELVRKKKKRAGGNITLLAHNGKTVVVFLSARTGLYGDIIERTYNLFIEEVKKGEVEVAIVGRHGLSLFLADMPNHPYTFFDIPDINYTAYDLEPVIKHVVQYEQIHVYFGQFVNVAKQVPDMLTISAEISLEENKAVKEKESYLFEPSMEEILIFFETQIFGALFDQSVREAQLAKLASRVMAMDAADDNIDKALSKLNIQRLQVLHRLRNRKQLNSLTSVITNIK
jgi:ATP synthase F1 gamma subunit